MKSLSMLRLMTAVLLIGVGSSVMAQTQTASSSDSGGSAVAKPLTSADKESEDCKKTHGKTWKVLGAGGTISGSCDWEPHILEQMKTCQQGLVDRAKLAMQIKNYCKKIQVEKDSKKTDSVISSCSEELDKCMETATTERTLSSWQTNVGSMLGMAGTAGLSGLDGFLDDEEGTCSRYSQEKLDSLIKEKKREVSDIDKDLKDAKKQELDEKRNYDEKSQEIQKSFNELLAKQDEEKNQKDVEKTKRKAEYDKQMRTMEAAQKAIDRKLLLAQKQQELLIERRKVQVAGYAKQMGSIRRSCALMVKKENPPVLTSGIGNIRAMKRDRERQVTECIDKVLSNRIEDAQKYDIQMEELKQRIEEGVSELDELSAERNSAIMMYGKLEAAAEQGDQTSYKNFLNKLGEMKKQQDDTDQEILRRKFNKTEQISKEEAKLRQASNELLGYRGQTALGEKSPEKAKVDLAELVAAQEKVKNNCPEKAQKGQVTGPADYVLTPSAQ